MADGRRVIVVGCGGLGSAALYRCAREVGASALAIEQFGLGHDRSASQDHSRTIRLAQHEPQYAALARPAYTAWDEVEAESGQTLVTRTGGLQHKLADLALGKPPAQPIDAFTRTRPALTDPRFPRTFHV